MKYYKTKNYLLSIEEVEVKGETENFVILNNGRKEAKISSWARYYKTREEAKQYHIRLIEDSISSHEQSIKDLNKNLVKAKAL